MIEIWVPQPSLPWPASTLSSRRSGTALNSSLHVVHAHGSVAWAFCWRGLCAAAIIVAHLLLTYYTYVPSWTSNYIWNSLGKEVYLPFSSGVTIKCDVRGSVNTPECSASAYFDRLLFGQNHLGAWRSQGLPECSSCSPGVCPREYSTAPAWCGAHMYDPEGALATVASAVAVIIGLYFGKVLVSARRWSSSSSSTSSSGLSSKHQLLMHWSLISFKLVAVGLGLKYAAGMPLNKQLWSLSYCLWMTGTCGAALTVTYMLVDVKGRQQKLCRAVLSPFQYMGMNAILVFFFHGPAEAAIHAVYTTRGPDPLQQDQARYTLLTWIRDSAIAAVVGSGPPAQFVYVLLKVACFMAVPAWCFRIKYFWKL